MMMREARNRKSSNSCWIRDGPGNRRCTSSHMWQLSTLKNTKMCFFGVHVSEFAHRDVPSHFHRVRAASWWGGGVLPGGCCPPRWSPSQCSNWAQSCRATRSRPPAWWLHLLWSPPSLKLEEEKQRDILTFKGWKRRLSHQFLMIYKSDWKGNLWAHWLGHPEVDTLGQSTQCTGTATWKEKVKSFQIFATVSLMHVLCFFLLNYLWLTPLMTDVGLHKGSWAVRTTERRNKLGFWTSGKAEVSDWLRV